MPPERPAKASEGDAYHFEHQTLSSESNAKEIECDAERIENDAKEFVRSAMHVGAQTLRVQSDKMAQTGRAERVVRKELRVGSMWMVVEERLLEIGAESFVQAPRAARELNARAFRERR